MTITSALRTIQNEAIRAKVFGRDDVLMYVSSVEPDGRKANKVIRELSNNGLIEVVEDNAKECRVNVKIALLTLTSEKFSCLQLCSDWALESMIEGRAPHGIGFDSLTSEHQIYALENKSDFNWFYAASNAGKQIEFEVGTALDYEQIRGKTLYISDEPLRTYVSNTARAKERSRLVKQNVKWALTELAGVDANMAAVWEDLAYSDGWSKYEIDGVAMNYENMASWDACADKRLARAEQEVAAAQMRLETAKMAAAKVKEYGGWSKLGMALMEAVDNLIISKDEG